MLQRVKSLWKNRIIIHIIAFLFIFLLLTLFYGGRYILIEMFDKFPTDTFYLEGSITTRGQVLIFGFSNSDVVVRSLVISMIVTISNYIIIKPNNLIITTFKLTFLVTLTYFLYGLVTAINYQCKYFYSLLNNLKDEALTLAGVFFVCSFSLLVLANRLMKNA
jgi:hypothetical protein